MTIVKGQDLMCFDVEKMHGVPCQNRTDCVIKRIVDKCKFEKGKGFTMSRYGCKVPKSEAWDLASEIIELLGIEEVDE